MPGPVQPKGTPPTPEPPKGPEGAQPTGFKMEGEANETFLGMHVTHQQKKEIYANLCKQILSDIKEQQKRMLKASRNLRLSEQGRPTED